jgi:arsenate reductase (glutaredoxin)
MARMTYEAKPMRDCILHNPRCSKSRETLKLLQDHGVELPVVEYLQTPPTAAELREICSLLGVEPLQLVRTKEALFAELGLGKDKGYGDAQWIDVLAAHPKLLERPIVVYRGKAALGRPPSSVLGLL